MMQQIWPYVMDKADNYRTRLSHLQAAFSFTSYPDALMLTLLTSVFHLKCQILKISLSVLHTILYVSVKAILLTGHLRSNTFHRTIEKK